MKLHTGAFDTNTEITELLGDPSFESGTTDWTLTGTPLMSIARVSYLDAYAGSYVVSASDPSGNPGNNPVSSISYINSGITGLSVDDIASYRISVKAFNKSGIQLKTTATLKLEGYAGSWSTLQSKSVTINPNTWAVITDSHTLVADTYTQFRFSAELSGDSKDYYTSYQQIYDDASFALYNGGNITELSEDGLLIFKDYDNIIRFDKNNASITFNEATINTLNSAEVFSSQVCADAFQSKSNLLITTNTGSVAPEINIVGATGYDSDTDGIFYQGSQVSILGGTGGKGHDSLSTTYQSGSTGGDV